MPSPPRRSWHYCLQRYEPPGHLEFVVSWPSPRGSLARRPTHRRTRCLVQRKALLPACRAQLWPGGIHTHWTANRISVGIATSFPFGPALPGRFSYNTSSLPCPVVLVRSIVRFERRRIRDFHIPCSYLTFLSSLPRPRDTQSSGPTILKQFQSVVETCAQTVPAIAPHRSCPCMPGDLDGY